VSGGHIEREHDLPQSAMLRRTTRSDAVPDQATNEIDAVLAEVAQIARPKARDGKVADYIPVLAEADPNAFGLALVDLDGTEHAIGDVDQPFAIQSISKVFSLVLAMQKADAHAGVAEELWSRVGREPSGDPYNSLVQLERERGIPRNPMINPGALVVDDVLLDHCEDAQRSTMDLLETLAREPLTIDEQVRDSEQGALHRNRAMANLLASFGNLTHDVDQVLDDYVHACSIAMSTRQLARAIRFLANDGVEPETSERIVAPELAKRVAAIMFTCGTYDAAGEFAFSVGLPCKSGVAGGIVGIVPGRMGVCVWSPPLDPSGNSCAGRTALHEISKRLDLSVV
jgi:glutaminase